MENPDEILAKLYELLVQATPDQLRQVRVSAYVHECKGQLARCCNEWRCMMCHGVHLHAAHSPRAAKFILSNPGIRYGVREKADKVPAKRKRTNPKRKETPDLLTFAAKLSRSQLGELIDLIRRENSEQ
jgi:hypothetical protein